MFTLNYLINLTDETELSKYRDYVITNKRFYCLGLMEPKEYTGLIEYFLTGYGSSYGFSKCMLSDGSTNLSDILFFDSENELNNYLDPFYNLGDMITGIEKLTFYNMLTSRFKSWYYLTGEMYKEGNLVSIRFVQNEKEGV